MIPDWLKQRLELENKDGIVSVSKIHHEPKPCDDCGKTVENRCMTIRKNQMPQPHWKITCTACKLIKNPDTGKFEPRVSQYMREKYGN
jgi:hypothetical protein